MGKGQQLTYWLHGEYSNIVDPVPPGVRLLEDASSCGTLTNVALTTEPVLHIRNVSAALPAVYSVPATLYASSHSAGQAGIGFGVTSQRPSSKLIVTPTPTTTATDTVGVAQSLAQPPDFFLPLAETVEALDNAESKFPRVMETGKLSTGFSTTSTCTITNMTTTTNEANDKLTNSSSNHETKDEAKTLKVRSVQANDAREESSLPGSAFGIAGPTVKLDNPDSSLITVEPCKGVGIPSDSIFVGLETLPHLATGMHVMGTRHGGFATTPAYRAVMKQKQCLPDQHPLDPSSSSPPPPSSSPSVPLQQQQPMGKIYREDSI
ncbi:unnamed protein product [Protopolystoma xenopodis]|uniref:Uncharacterized protein n=1 Tax=Protopolystoma xenopodis TaxID=117903 RepID=A0A3S5BLV7_9PLAT|nr:unnamed protein product [Protopolystoma xenopodis]